MIEAMIALIIAIVIVGLIAGLIIYLIRRAPIPAPFNQWAEFLVLVVAVLIIIVRALPLLGVG